MCVAGTGVVVGAGLAEAVACVRGAERDFHIRQRLLRLCFERAHIRFIVRRTRVCLPEERETGGVRVYGVFDVWLFVMYVQNCL